MPSPNAVQAVAVIPARGGSKRVPRKNIKLFHGRPIIAWVIETALRSNLFAQVVVSTDDAEIAAVAGEHGAQVPFLRTSALADDHTGTTEVVQDAIARLALAPQTPVCCLYATAALLRAEDLRAGHDLLLGGAGDYAMSVGRYTTPIQRAYRLEGARLRPFDPTMMPMRSQDLEPAYFDAGQFYWATAQTWLRPSQRVWDSAAPVLLPHERVCDIDTPDDWALAEALFALAKGV